MTDKEQADIAASQVTRRTFLKTAAALSAAGLGAPLLPEGRALARSHSATRSEFPIKHVIVSCQENRSFDHYYGYAPWIGPYGVPANYSQPDGNGGTVKPYHFTSRSTPDIYHAWTSVHTEWDHGKMDGFHTNDGINAMGYYLQQDLPFYYRLHHNFTLCVNYFCSVLGPTYPNRFYLVSGTSGGITDNAIYGYGVLDYPMILDLLEGAHVSWKVYNIGFDSVPNGDSDNVFVFFKRWAHDPRTQASKMDYLRDVAHGRLPQVSFIIPSYTMGYDEHPPADISVGMRLQKELIGALMASRHWRNSAFILTYDEHGGYFDHVAPPQFDAYGPGIRVPTWVVSPYAKKGHLEPALYEHASILKFIETLFDLPTLASVNHQFDTSTPGGPTNEAANGAAYGPPAPPRDGVSAIGNLMECFNF